MKRINDFIFRPKKNPNYEALKKAGVYDALRLALIVTPLFILAVISTLLFSLTWDETYIKTALQNEYRFYCNSDGDSRFVFTCISCLDNSYRSRQIQINRKRDMVIVSCEKAH